MARRCGSTRVSRPPPTGSPRSDHQRGPALVRIISRPFWRFAAKARRSAGSFVNRPPAQGVLNNMRTLFTAGAAVLMAGVVFPGSVPSAGASAVQAAGRCRSTAYVSNFDDGTVTPVNTVTRRAGKPIALQLPGQHDGAGDVAVTPNGKKAYVVNGGDEAQSVTPITTAANKAGRAIPASVYQLGPVIALSEHTLTPISTATGKPGKGTALPFAAFGMAVTPNGRTVYVSNWAGGTVIPIRTATGAAGRPIKVGKLPYQIVITPNGMTAYVLNIGSNSVTPIKTRTNKPQKAVKVPVTFGAGHMLALTPNGKTLLVLGVRTVTPISTAHNHARKPIKIRTPADIAITRDGKTAWVITPGNNAIVPVNITRDR